MCSCVILVRHVLVCYTGHVLMCYTGQTCGGVLDLSGMCWCVILFRHVLVCYTGQTDDDITADLGPEDPRTRGPKLGLQLKLAPCYPVRRGRPEVDHSC